VILCQKNQAQAAQRQGTCIETIQNNSDGFNKVQDIFCKQFEAHQK
jgi:hypothetical protein